MRQLLYSLSLFVSVLFFCVSAIISGNDMETGTTISYTVVCVISFLLCIAVFSFSDALRLNNKNLLTIVIALLFSFIGLLSGYMQDRSFLCMTAFCLPATCIAIGFSKDKSLCGLIKWLDIICVLITLSLYYSILRLRVSIIDGVSYYSQTLSYLSGFTFVLDLFLLRIGDRIERFSFFTSKLYRFCSYVFLAIYPVVILLSGGRGGFVVVIVGIIAFIIQTEKKKRGRLFLAMSLVVALFFSVLFFARGVSFLSVFSSNIGRVFSYLTEHGIDLNQTSGRDWVYKEAWSLFLAGPPFGYGLFNYKAHLIDQPYPHNLFLEWLLQGGVIMLMVGLAVLIVFFVRLKALSNIDKESAVIITPFVIYSLVKLMFSGSYLEEPFFWFCISFVFNYPIKSHRRQYARFSVR